MEGSSTKARGERGIEVEGEMEKEEKEERMGNITFSICDGCCLMWRKNEEKEE